MRDALTTTVSPKPAIARVNGGAVTGASATAIVTGFPDEKPLEAAVIAVMGGHCYRSPSLRSGRLPYLSCPRLTPREYEVLDLLASGLTDREIAERLVVSEETSRTYTKRLLKTLEVNNRVQAVLKGMRCGMVQL